MKPEIVDIVPGVSEDDLAAFQVEAEEGYDLGAMLSGPNPHRLQVVPDDLVAEVERVARARGVAPEAVIRAALTEYLATTA
ncbi:MULTISPECIES: CopG family transcriptional regulator [Actinomyces]|uniref:Ribbon-helix-helix protein, CopG family n=1 Tax=Actinomyces respiraculi TaxID=2744574 RepID=A0A7T0PWB7_9ACTO|nr:MULTISPECIES: CopG family transcriptional regulator [Actinomyces]QPL06201.1 ribbon-helix-helix protein, CopG family [Actinomyces respiraculi]